MGGHQDELERGHPQRDIGRFEAETQVVPDEAVSGEAAGARQEGQQGEGVEAPKPPPQPSSAEEAT